MVYLYLINFHNLNSYFTLSKPFEADNIKDGESLKKLISLGGIDGLLNKLKVTIKVPYLSL